MQIAQVIISEMFASYSATSEGYTPDELIFRCSRCKHERIFAHANRPPAPKHNTSRHARSPKTA